MSAAIQLIEAKINDRTKAIKDINEAVAKHYERAKNMEESAESIRREIRELEGALVLLRKQP